MAEEKKFRVESDLLGELKVPAGALYGIQTQRGINNYHISRKTMCSYPDFIIAIAYVKLAAIETNHTLGVINDEISGAISQACREIIEGTWHENSPIDARPYSQSLAHASTSSMSSHSMMGSTGPKVSSCTMSIS